jgi:hypothetical protein
LIRFLWYMHEERQINPTPASLVSHRTSIRSVAKKDIAIQRDPLTAVLATMFAEPLLLSLARVNCFQRRDVRDGHVDALLLNERERFKRTQQPILVYRFQFTHHDLIVAEGPGTLGVAATSGLRAYTSELKATQATVSAAEASSRHKVTTEVVEELGNCGVLLLEILIDSGMHDRAYNRDPKVRFQIPRPNSLADRFLLLCTTGEWPE